MITKRTIILNYIAILSTFIFAGAGTFMNAAMQVLLDAWPSVSPNLIRMVVTIPPLASLPVMLIIGRLVGHRLTYRLSCLIGLGIITLAGVAPFFLSRSWGVILGLRFVLGLGVGFLAVRNPLIMLAVPDHLKTRFIGIGTILMSLGATIAAPVVGYLTQYSWRFVFLFNGFALIPFLIIMFFLKEPAQATVREEEQYQSKDKFHWRTYTYILLQFVTTLLVYPLLSGIATYMADHNIGTAVVAGTLLSIYTLSGMLSNLVLQPLLTLLKRWTIPVMFFVIAAGFMLILCVPILPTTVIGVGLSGAGFGVLMSVFQIYNGKTLPSSAVASASTAILAANQMGVFLSTYLITVSHGILHRSTDVESTYLLAVVAFIILITLTSLINVSPTTKQ